MGHIINKSLKNVFISYSGILLGAVNTLILFQYFTTDEEFGLTRLFVSLASTAALVASGGLNTLIIRVYPRFAQKYQVKALFVKGFFVIPTILLMLIIIGYYLFNDFIALNYAEDSNLFSAYMHWIPLFLLGNLVFNLLDGYARTLHKVVLSSLLRDVGTRVYTAFLIGLYALNIINFNLFMGLFCAQFLLLSIFLFTSVYGELKCDLLAKHEFDKQFVISPFSEIWKEIHPFVWLNFASASTNIFIANIDNLMLAQYVNLGEIGIYNFGLYIATLVIIPFRILAKITYPVFSEHMVENQIDKVNEIYSKGSTNMLWFGMLIFLGIWANLPDLILYVKPVYQNVESIFLFLSASHLFTLMVGLSAGILLNSPYYYFDNITSALLVILLITTNLWFIPNYGINGAAMATSLSIGLYQLSRLIFVWYKYKVQPISKATIHIFVISIFIMLLNGLIQLSLEAWINIIIRSLLITIIYFGLNIVLKTSPLLNQIILKVLTLKKDRS